MHALLANLMTLSLVFHAALGCCWHHEHHCRHAGEAVACESAASCEHCQEHGSPANHGPHPCGCEVECKGICTYVGPQEVEFEASLAVAPFASVAVDSLLRDAEAASGAAWHTVDPARFEPPLRLHLLHQIVLI